MTEKKVDGVQYVQVPESVEISEKRAAACFLISEMYFASDMTDEQIVMTFERIKTALYSK